jgi:hypothetical protein
VNNAFESGDFDRKLYWSEHNDFVLTPHAVCSSSIVLPIDDNKLSKFDDSSINRSNSLQESQRPKSSEFGSSYSAPGKSLPFEQDDEAYMSSVA